MDYKVCPHYDEIVRVLVASGNLDEVSFGIEEVQGCIECCEGIEDTKKEYAPVCGLWVSCAFIIDLNPQLNIKAAKLTIDNLDAQFSDIVREMLYNAEKNFKNANNIQCIDEPNYHDIVHYKTCPHYDQLLKTLATTGNVLDLAFELNENNNCEKCTHEAENICNWWAMLSSEQYWKPNIGYKKAKLNLESLDRTTRGIKLDIAHDPDCYTEKNYYTKACPQYKACPHYNELLNTLAKSGRMNEVAFEIEDVQNCKTCTDNNIDMCEWWFKLSVSKKIENGMGMTRAQFIIETMEWKMRKKQ